MKIAIEIDPNLLESVMESTGESTESGAVNAALAEYARRKSMREWIDSWGEIVVDDLRKDEGVMKANERRRAFLDSLWDDPMEELRRLIEPAGSAP